MFNILGFDIGYDLINDNYVVFVFVKFFDLLEKENFLLKIILYFLNLKDNYVFVIIMGFF